MVLLAGRIEADPDVGGAIIFHAAVLQGANRVRSDEWEIPVRVASRRPAGSELRSNLAPGPAAARSGCGFARVLPRRALLLFRCRPRSGLSNTHLSSSLDSRRSFDRRL